MSKSIGESGKVDKPSLECMLYFAGCR